VKAAGLSPATFTYH